MRYILISIATIVMLSGCGLCTTKERIVTVEKEVFVTPKFDMPPRPEIRKYNGQVSDALVIRNIEFDLLDISTYATQLENILKKIKSNETINNQ